MCLCNIWIPPLVIEATDKDNGINALLVYEILEAEAKTFFAIDESTGALRTMVSLDFETKQRFEFEVRVSDRGLPRSTADSTTKVSKENSFFLSNRNKFAHAPEVELRARFFSSNRNKFARAPEVELRAQFSRQITTIFKASKFVCPIGFATINT